ncbi:MAG: hypothetical protein LBK76_06220 [Verrucomicrobiales bacterium]|jgi:hypothetical protein|nr:hypothetical protein [Verrucomicrobiales bacterium]
MNKANFSCKKYITRTWPGIREFFTQYVGVLPGIRERLSLPSPEIGLITNSAAGFGRLNDIIVELEKLLTGFRDVRRLVVTQKNGDLVTMPDTQRLRALLDTLGTINGGLLWLEDTLTDAILRNPKHTQADLDLLGVTYQPTPKPDPAQSVGRIYPTFTGGDVTNHWTLPRGLTDARVSRSINHGDPVVVYQGSENSFTDNHPIAAQSQVWAYTLEPLLHGKLYGKPITEKIIVGADIAIEEEKI